MVHERHFNRKVSNGGQSPSSCEKQPKHQFTFSVLLNLQARNILYLTKVFYAEGLPLRFPLCPFSDILRLSVVSVYHDLPSREHGGRERRL